MERSDIRVLSSSDKRGIPDFAALIPGYVLAKCAGPGYRTVLRSSTVLSNTRLMVQIQRLPANASGYRQ
jgi:hypothetical protein